MELSNSAPILREMIERAIEDHQITRHEYDMIIHQASKDGVIDKQEESLLSLLHEMITDKSVKLVP